MAFGFQASGAMDKKAYEVANILVGNAGGESAIEMTLIGLSGEFTSDAVIAVTGADVSPELNGVSIPRYRAVAVKKGDVLSCGFAQSGCRAYLAVHGGFFLKKVMDSYSTNVKCGIGGYLGRPLKKEDLLYFNTVSPKVAGLEKRGIEPPKIESCAVVRAVLGPQDDYFTEKGIRTFFSSEYKLTNESDRMGIKLDGAEIESKNGSDIISDGIPFGGIQIPASGKPIVMAADRQTVGGYAKIATVISSDMAKLAQLKAGDTVRFKEISVADAQDVYLKEMKEIDELDKKLNGKQYKIGEAIKKIWKK
jgi:biotin-dependent carboxylase-like uncharacterized protein